VRGLHDARRGEAPDLPAHALSDLGRIAVVNAAPDAGVADLCISDPGFEVDIYVDAELGAMANVWLGDLQFSEAVRAKKIRLTGMPALIRQFPSWLLLSHFAAVPRPQT